ncbi:BA14K family protein [Sinorhizobium fredii]|uniref:BA14K family protein n=1 Tax=Rhizobium fredii TaxID=380 RepID=UPI001297B840|nr:BA14K family protein [Sinorhizobium fredii]MQW94287.1 BA14K family protein [Sinorhizobium fredii]UTY46145.1 BA14K family protein [Sinorhizobium fredii]
MKRLAIATLSLVTALTSVPPAVAFPTVVAPKIEATEAQPVQYRRYRGGYYRGGHHHNNGGDDWAWALGGLATGAIIGGLLAQPRYYGPGYYDQGYYDQGYYDQGYYGHSYYGPTYYRPRYYAPRYYREAYYGGNAHTRWCYGRYRSYRAYDNTFQPYYGPRRACVSPYY